MLNLPLREAQSGGEGILGALGNINALSEQNLKNAQQRIANKYAGPAAEAQIALTQANTAKQNVIQNAIQSILGGGNPVADLGPQSSSSSPFSASAPPGGLPISANQIDRLKEIYHSAMNNGQLGPQANPSQNNLNQLPAPSAPHQNNAMNYGKAALISKLLGFGAPPIIDVNGEKIAVSPFGNISIAKGLDPLHSALAKENAKEVAQLQNSVFSGNTKQQTFDELGKIISSPAFEQVRQTPALGSHELSYFARFGTPEQQQLVGKFKTLTGNIVKDTAQDFKGQFRKGEQSLVNSMKVNDSDTFNAARGKLEALSIMNKMLVERSRLTAKYMEQGDNSLTAQEKADREINGDEIRKQIHEQLNPNEKDNNESLKKITKEHVTDENIAYTAKQLGISEDEVKRRLKNKGLL